VSVEPLDVADVWNRVRSRHGGTDFIGLTLAKKYLARHQGGLRAGDALHLAIARNRGSERIYSLDNTLLKAGRSLGLPMTRGL
jgi:predicted nucleic acid-binding protein